jgi:lysozyme
MNFESYHYIDEGIKDQLKSGAITLATATALNAANLDPIELYNQIADHEGVVQQAYVDSTGHKTIGIGFNLDDASNIKKLEKIGVSVEDLLSGKQLSDSEIKTLYNISISQAYRDAKTFLPDLESHPSDVQKAVVDMSFNLGLTRLLKFKQVRQALFQRNYRKAADEMLNSLWAKQTGRRAQKLANMVRNAT